MRNKQTVQSVYFRENGGGAINIIDSNNFVKQLLYTEAPEDISSLNGREVILSKVSLFVGTEVIGIVRGNKVSFIVERIP